MYKNVASQYLDVFAFADPGHASLDAGEPVTGDAANITGTVEQDSDTTHTALNDTNPTEIAGGWYRFTLTQAETNGDKLFFKCSSSTAGVQVVVSPSSVIYTRPPNFSALSITALGYVSGSIVSSGIPVGAFQAGSITATAFAVGALTKTTFATGAIDSGALDSTAVTEIQSGLATSANQTTIINYVDLIDDATNGLAAIKAAANSIYSDTQSILTDTATTIPGLIAALNDLDAAGVRTAVGLAAANLDTQLGTVAKTGADGDTLETLSDQLDGIGALSGEGAYTGTLTVNDGSTGLEGAVVNARLGGVLKATGTTNPSGQITNWTFAAATYDLAVRLAGYQPTTSTVAVSADAWTKTISLTALSITAPAAVSLCTVQFRVKLSDTAVQGAVCKATLLGTNQAADGTILSNEESSDTTDSQGVAELQLVRKDQIVKGSGLYKICVEIAGQTVSSVETKIPAQSTVLYEDLL